MNLNSFLRDGVKQDAGAMRMLLRELQMAFPHECGWTHAFQKKGGSKEVFFVWSQKPMANPGWYGYLTQSDHILSGEGRDPRSVPLAWHMTIPTQINTSPSQAEMFRKFMAEHGEDVLQGLKETQCNDYPGWEWRGMHMETPDIVHIKAHKKEKAELVKVCFEERTRDWMGVQR